MSAAASIALKTYLAQKQPRAFTIADLYTLTFLDGTIIRLTSFDRDVVYLGQTYSALGPRLRRGAISYKRGLEVSETTLDIYSAPTDIANAGLSYMASLAKGQWDGARVRGDRVYDPVAQAGGAYSADLALDVPTLGAAVLGAVNLGAWLVGDAQVGRMTISLTLQSGTVLLNTMIPRHLYQAGCPWQLYDANCKLTRSDFEVSGAVIAGSSKSRIYLPTIVIPVTAPQGGANAPTGWLDLGAIAFSSGQNASQRRSIKSFISAAQADYETAVMNAQPLAFYKLNDAFGSGTAVDSSGNGYDATVNGGVTLGVAGGLVGDAATAATFNGSSGYLSIPVPDPTGTALYGGAFTFEAMVKPAGHAVSTISNAVYSGGIVTVTTSSGHGLSPGEIVVITGATPSGYNGTFVVISSPTGTTFTYALPSDPGAYSAGGSIANSGVAVNGLFCSRSSPKQSNRLARNYFGGWEWSPKAPLVATVMTAGAWQHLAVVFRGEQFVDVYIGGKLFATSSDNGKGNIAWANALIGKAMAYGGSDAFFDGSMQCAALYAYDLPPEVIAAHAAAAVVGPSAPVLPAGAGGYVDLLTPLLFTPAAGDLFVAAPGCNRSLHECLYKFSNKQHFGGEPFSPQDEAAM